MAMEVLTTCCIAIAITCIFFTQTRGQLDDDANILWPSQEQLSSFGLPEDLSPSIEPMVERELIWNIDPVSMLHLGQTTGLATSVDGKLFLFTRAERQWQPDSFDTNGNFTQRSLGPIKNDTIVIVDGQTGKFISSHGKNRFYMPHGMSIDHQGNIWVTDVALHQVMKFSPNDLENPILTLGEAFKPGSDEKHFCQPTDVVVSSNGYAFISDGYCNSRIVVVDPEGKVIGTIALDELVIPHSLTLLEKEDLLCIADRENRRIPCYSAGLSSEVPPGQLMLDLRNPMIGRVFAIDHIGNLLFAVSGPDEKTDSPVGVIINLETESLVGLFAPLSGFGNPHDIAINVEGDAVFVSDISKPVSQSIYKFTI